MSRVGGRCGGLWRGVTTGPGVRRGAEEGGGGSSAFEGIGGGGGNRVEGGTGIAVVDVAGVVAVEIDVCPDDGVGGPCVEVQESGAGVLGEGGEVFAEFEEADEQVVVLLIERRHAGCVGRVRRDMSGRAEKKPIAADVRTRLVVTHVQRPS